MDRNPSSVVDRCRHRSTPKRVCRLAFVLLFVLTSVVLRCLSTPSGPPPPPPPRLVDDPPRRAPQRRSPPSAPATAAAVVNASDLDVVRVRRVNTIRDEILKKLRMESAPNVTVNGRQLRTMRQILNLSDSEESQTTNANDDDDDDEEESAGPVIVIVRSRAVPVAGFNASTACYFKFPDDLTESSQVINATLGVYLRATDHSVRSSSSSSSSSLRLVVRKNVRYSDPVIYRRKRIQGSSSRGGIGGGGWVTIDVKSLVQSWISQPNDNVGVTIVTSDAHGGQHPTAIVQPMNSQEETMRPFIDLRVKPMVGSPGGRQARSVGGGGGGGMDCNENSVEQRCCRYPLTIDFEEFRWDWIMVPKRYEAFYCSGRCSQFFYQSPARTAVQSQAATASSSTADTCCAATEVAPLSIIHLNDKSPGYIHTSLPGMVVKQCGCL